MKVFPLAFFYDDLFLAHLPSGEKWLAIGLLPLHIHNSGASKALKKHLYIVEDSRPLYNAFCKAGFCCTSDYDNPFPEIEAFNGALLHLSKYKALNYKALLTLLKRLPPASPIVIRGDKNLGVHSFLKNLEKYFPLLSKEAKGHGVTFSIARPTQIPEAFLTIANIGPQRFEEYFTTEPGMFSHGKIDKGSQLLTRYFENDIHGAIADFGAGWGYLSFSLLQKLQNPEQKITRLDLFEANKNALEAAKRHLLADDLCAYKKKIPIEFFWHDILEEKFPQFYDYILCNPPFHSHKKAEFSLGEAFIHKTSAQLKPHGKLLMVCNSHLPYEKSLHRSFKKVSVLTTENGFKVFLAQK